jgi:CheY-like chemotaxis protein
LSSSRPQHHHRNRQRSRTPPSQAHGEPTDRRTTLYIEDNLSNLKLGIDLAHRHQPDLIILDLHLPDMHGRDVLARLEQDPVTAPIPVVIISADATPGQVNLLQASGAAAYLTKPIAIIPFLDMVAETFKNAPTDQSLTAP